MAFMGAEATSRPTSSDNSRRFLPPPRKGEGDLAAMLANPPPPYRKGLGVGVIFGLPVICDSLSRRRR